MNREVLISTTAILFIVVVVFVWRYSPSTNQLPDSLNPISITISGKHTCLPKVGTGPHTLECAWGLKGDDGKYYALKDLYEADPNLKFSETENRIEVRGTLKPEKSLGPDGVPYDVIGTIYVNSVKKIDK